MTKPLSEFQRIDRFFKPLAAGYPGALGLSDDAALIDVPIGQELVVTTDAMVAGVHFLPDDRPQDIAARLLRSNLSDLAAMGATPLAYTLVTSLPRDLDVAWLAAFTEGLAADQKEFGIHLIGGDSTATPGPIVLTLTAFGTVPKGQTLRRNAMQPGDRIFVSGTIGDSTLGLRIALGQLDVADPEHRDFLLRRFYRPEPRLALGQILRELQAAVIDVSDGLVADLGHICETSGVSAQVKMAKVPLSAAAKAVLVLGRYPHLHPDLLTGGEDYELVFAIRPDHAAKLVSFAHEVGITVTEIGCAMIAAERPNVEVVDESGFVVDFINTGYKHF